VTSPPRHVDSYRPIVPALVREGVDPAELLASLGVDPQAPVNRSARPPDEIALALLDRAVELCGEGFAARAAAPFELASLGLYGLVLMAAPTVGDALERGIRYRRLVFGSDDYGLDRDADPAELYRRPLADALVREFPRGARAVVELGLLEHARALFELAGDAAAACVIHVAHHPPGDGGAALREVARLPVEFGAARSGLHISAALLSAPARHGHPAYADFFATEADQRLDAAPQSVADRVRLHLSRELRGAVPRAPATAAALGMSERTLTRRLAAENSSYPELLDQVRCELALGWLRRPQISLAEIAFLLGFSEASAFHRAFRRWTGRTPGDVRERG